MLGGGGGVAPLQKIFSLLGPPHGSLPLPEQAMLQSVAGSETFLVNALPQSESRLADSSTLSRINWIWDWPGTKLAEKTYSIPENIPLPHICNFCFDKM